MRDLLRFITCGSVDDGKSTLIGHILYDAKLLYADQQRALELASKAGSRGGAIDYALLLDGLTEEREQGITIDVAYRYFTTDVRSFIVADTPGHEEYTRNMAVGASSADLAVILVDAAKGVLIQTRRHARICSVMGIRYFVFAVNKMDLIRYDEKIFQKICTEIAELCKETGIEHAVVIPVSATEGDNVTKPSDRMKWYSGTTLLDYLEQVDVNETAELGFYLPVQRVCRPDHTFRGYQGQIESGQIRTGDQVTVLPGNETAGISSILAGDRSVQEAAAGQAVTLQLDREIDISRGSVICKDAALETADTITATLIWMDDMPLQNGNHYFVKLGTGMLPGLVTKILYTVDINTGKFRETDILQKNEIAVCRIVLTDRIPADRFRTHRTLGELILIDRVSFMTSACGVVEQCEKSTGFTGEKATEETRCACLGQKSVTVAFRSAGGISEALLEKAEKKLLLGGRHTYLLAPDPAWNVSQTEAVLAHLNRAGIIVMLLLTEQEAEHFQEKLGTDVIWYAGEHRDADAISSFVRSVSTWTNDIVNGPQYI